MATITDLWAAFARLQASSNAMMLKLTAIGDPEIDRQYNFYRLVLVNENEGCVENAYEDTVIDWQASDDGIKAMTLLAESNEERAAHG